MTIQDVQESGGLVIGAQAFIDLGSKMDKIHREIARERNPIIKPVGVSGVAPAGGAFTLVIQEGPQRGRIWNILKVIVCGADLHTTVTGAVDVYAGSTPDISGPTLDNGILGSTVIPVISSFSRLVEWCSTGENIFAQLTGVTAGANVNLVARVAEYPVPSVEAMTIR